MTVVINGSTGITNVNGSASAPAETGVDTDTGIYYGTNTVGLATNGTSALFVDANQNVGIGTSTPRNLEIVRSDSNTSPFSSAAQQPLVIRNSDTTNGNMAQISFVEGASSLTSGVALGCIYTNHTSLAADFVMYTATGGSTFERARITSGGDFKFNSGYGSVATAYGCRAWANFNGSSASIRSSGNVTSVTRNGTGDYTVNFTSAMPDANYSFTAFCKISTAGVSRTAFANGDNGNTTQSASSYRFYTTNLAGTPSDTDFVNVAIFR